MFGRSSCEAIVDGVYRCVNVALMEVWNIKGDYKRHEAHERYQQHIELLVRLRHIFRLAFFVRVVVSLEQRCVVIDRSELDVRLLVQVMQVIRFVQLVIV